MTTRPSKAGCVFTLLFDGSLLVLVLSLVGFVMAILADLPTLMPKDAAFAGISLTSSLFWHHCRQEGKP